VGGEKGPEEGAEAEEEGPMMKDAIVEFKVFTRTSGREVLDALEREKRGLEEQELEQQAEVSRLDQ
jgi:hypothetical protein